MLHELEMKKQQNKKINIIQELEMLYRFQNIPNKTIYKIKLYGSYILKSQKEATLNKNIFRTAYNNYQYLLQNINALAKELNLNTSLEYANLFTYLL